MDIFIEISLILVVTTGVALLMQYLKQPLILGHILSGILLGPIVLNLISGEVGPGSAGQTLHIFSQFGISILLFIVGLNLSPTVMREVGKASLLTGIGQIVFTSIIGGIIGMLLGFSVTTSLYLGVAFALSSTIIVTKFLSDRKDTNKLYGKIAIGFLLVQDVIATLCLIAIASFQSHLTFPEALFPLLKSILAIGVLFILSVYLLPRLTHLFAASQEFLLLFSLGWGLGIAALFQALGFTGEIGALVAGIALAGSPYHYEISSKMKLLRDFFLVIFFVLLGAQLSFTGIEHVWLPAVIFSAFVLIGNPLIVIALMGWLGYHRKTSFLAGLTVAQISEFSLLIVLFAIRAGQLSDDMLSLVTLVGLITIGISSYLMNSADALYRWFGPRLRWFERPNVFDHAEKCERYDAILFGYHRVGTDFLPSMQKWRKKFLVVDFDPEVVHQLSEKGIACRYGDAQDNEFLDELCLSGVRIIVSTIPDFETNAFLINKLRKKNKSAVAILTAHSIEEARLLYDAGASYVIMPHFLGGNYAALLVQKHGFHTARFAAERKKHLAHILSKAA